MLKDNYCAKRFKKWEHSKTLLYLLRYKTEHPGKNPVAYGRLTDISKVTGLSNQYLSQFYSMKTSPGSIVKLTTNKTVTNRKIGRPKLYHKLTKI